MSVEVNYCSNNKVYLVRTLSTEETSKITKFYVDLVYKLRKLLAGLLFSISSEKLCSKCIGYNINILRQCACLLKNTNTVDFFTSLFKLNTAWSCIRLNEGPNIKLVE